MPADRVAAFDAGEVVDFDSPSALLTITKPEEAPRFHPRSGVLAALVGQAGLEVEGELRSMAAAGFIRRRLLVYARSRIRAAGGRARRVSAARRGPQPTGSGRTRPRPLPVPQVTGSSAAGVDSEASPALTAVRAVTETPSPAPQWQAGTTPTFAEPDFQLDP